MVETAAPAPTLVATSHFGGVSFLQQPASDSKLQGKALSPGTAGVNSQGSSMLVACSRFVCVCVRDACSVVACPPPPPSAYHLTLQSAIRAVLAAGPRQDRAKTGASTSTGSALPAGQEGKAAHATLTTTVPARPLSQFSRFYDVLDEDEEGGVDSGSDDGAVISLWPGTTGTLHVVGTRAGPPSNPPSPGKPTGIMLHVGTPSTALDMSPLVDAAEVLTCPLASLQVLLAER